MQIEEIKDQICDVCHKMWQLGWVAANDGNVSVRLEDGTFLATPTGMSKSFITPDKLLRIDAKGNVLEGAEGLRPSSEIKMHLRCYEKRADVNAVVHAHPPAATGFAVAHRPMDMYNMIEDVAAIGLSLIHISLITVVGAALPPLIIISIISAFYQAFRSNKYVSMAMAGMLAGVAAVIFDAVSYTHLDVYKRQMMPPAKALPSMPPLPTMSTRSCLLYTSRCV